MKIPEATRRKTKVCHVVYGRYPEDPRVRRAMGAILGPEYTLTVLCTSEPGKPSHDVCAGVQVHRVPLEAVRGSRIRYLYQYSIFFLIAAALLFPRSPTHRYHIIHVHSLPDFLVFAALPCRLLGSRVILDLHESMPHLYLARFHDRPGSWIYRLSQIAEKVSCLVASHVVTVNATIQDLLRAEGVEQSKLSVIENAPAWSMDQPPVVPDLDRVEVAVVGGLNPERDIDLLLHATKLLQSHDPLKVRIIGHGDADYVSHLETLRDSLGLQACVTIESPIPASSVQDVLNKSLFGIVTYARNPLTELATPNKAYEYAALGKAMVVADLPAIHRLFGDAVLYYEPGQASSLADAMSKLVEDTDLRRTLGRRAAEVHAAHSWDKMETRLRALYEGLSRETIGTAANA